MAGPFGVVSAIMSPVKTAWIEWKSDHALEQGECDCSPEQADAIESLLWALGAVSVTFSDSQDNPIFEPPVGEHPLWQQSEISALFDQESDLSEITDAIAAECDASVHVEALVERAWEREWLDQFKPMAFGDRLWIVP